VATIGKVAAVFTASTSGLKAGVKEASDSFKRLQKDTKSTASSLRALTAIQGAQLFGSIASAARDAARSMVNMAGAESETIDQTSKLARRLGMTYGELSGLSLAGNLAGVSMDTIGKAATKADIALVKAVQGSAQAKAAFAGIGLSVQQLQGLSPAERFQKITDAIAKLPTEAERARAAVALFGKSGADLLPLFEGGAGSIRAATEEAKRFGLALTNEQGQSVEAMNDAFTRAYAAVSGVVQQVVAYLAPALQGVTDTFTNLIGGIGGANIGQFIGDAILNAAVFFAGIADYFISNAGSIWEYASQVGAQWSTVFEIASRVASFFMGVGNVLQVVFAQVIAGITGPITLLLKAVNSVAKFAGIDLGIDVLTAQMAGFTQSLNQSAQSGFGSAFENFGAAFSGGESGGQPIKGPVTTALTDAINKSRADAAAINTSKPQTIAGGMAMDGEGDAGGGVTASTSTSGNAGMGDVARSAAAASSNIGERQLAILEQIRDALSSNPTEALVDFAGG
jgi:hypothetical protein